MIRPFLKWAGGKSRVLPDLLPYLPKADLLIEPFVGGASVFLNTDYRHYILADVNYDLINLYRMATHHTELLIDTAAGMFKEGNNPECYYVIRDNFNSQSISAAQGWHPGRRYGSNVQWIIRAAQFLYLNRYGFNGICRYSLAGNYNVPRGKYKSVYFPETEIRQFAEKARDTKALFLCASFQQTLKIFNTRDAVIYCDPPYLPASKTGNFTQYYGGEFKKNHHTQLVESLIAVNQEFGVPVIISNSNTPETRAIYSAFKFHEISVNRSVSANAITRGAAKEVIGVLKTCEGCGRHGGGMCPDCGPCCGDATYKIMQAAGGFDE